MKFLNQMRNYILLFVRTVDSNLVCNRASRLFSESERPNIFSDKNSIN